MKRPYLQMTYRKGRPIAAYLYLPRPSGAKSARTVETRPGILVDHAETGEPIGVELTAPEYLDVKELEEVLRGLGWVGMEADLAPLRAA